MLRKTQEVVVLHTPSVEEAVKRFGGIYESLIKPSILEKVPIKAVGIYITEEADGTVGVRFLTDDGRK